MSGALPYALALCFVLMAMLKVGGPGGWRDERFFGCPGCGGLMGRHAKDCHFKDR